MADAVDSAGGAASQQRYFCHQCNREVNLVPPAAADPICPVCGGSFVEELDLPPTHPSHDLNPNPRASASTFFTIQPGVPDPFLASPSTVALLSSAGNIDLRSAGDFARLLGLDLTAIHSQTPSTLGYDPQLFFRDYIQSFISDGASIQIVFDNSGAGGQGGTSLSLPGNIRDYFSGSRLEHLIHQLFENDPNRYGPPPAAKSAVETLPVIKISDELVAGSDEAQCAVCKEAFVVGEEAVQMPCKHIYHKDCIIPWLELHNSCPVCRYELPTDDPDYENRVRRVPPAPGVVPATTTVHNWRPTLTTRGTIGGEQRPPERRIVQRRIRIYLPWSRVLGSQTEANSNAAGLNGVSGTGSNTAGSQNDLAGRRNNGCEPHQEDMD